MTFERHTFNLPLLTISPYSSPPLAHRLLTTSCSPSIPTHCLPFSHSPHTHQQLLLTISSCSPFPPVHCLPLLTTFSYLPSLPANHLPLLPLLTPLSLTHHLPPCSLSSPLLTPPAAQHLPLLTPLSLTTSPCSPPSAHPPFPYSPPPPAHLPLLTPLSLTHHLPLLTSLCSPPSPLLTTTPCSPPPSAHPPLPYSPPPPAHHLAVSTYSPSSPARPCWCRRGCRWAASSWTGSTLDRTGSSRAWTARFAAVRTSQSAVAFWSGWLSCQLQCKPTKINEGWKRDLLLLLLWWWWW